MVATICRLCFKQLDRDDPQIRSISDDGFQKALKAVFPFKILLAENLPVYACKNCVWNVLDFYCYSELVLKNQETLQVKLLPEEKEENNPTIKQLENMLKRLENTTEKHLLTCKAELDDVHVVNEPHPDTMDYSFEQFEQYDASITCEDYKITADFYDNVTEHGEVVADENIVTGAVGADENDTNQLSTVQLEPETQKPKRQNVRKAYNASNTKRNPKRRTTANPKDGAVFACPCCNKTFNSSKKLEIHTLGKIHDKETCTICNKTVGRRYMPTHMYIVHSVSYEKQVKLKQDTICSKQQKKPNTSVRKTRV